MDLWELFFMLIPLFVVLMVLILHFKSYFRISFSHFMCNNHNKSKNKNNISWDNTDDWCLYLFIKICKYSCIVGLNGIKFGPALYLTHLFILILLFGIIMIKFIINPGYNDNSHEYCSINNVFSIGLGFDKSLFDVNTGYIDIIIIYLYVYVLLIDCYFNFQRYYSTYKTIKELVIPTHWYVLKKYLIFMTPIGAIIIFEIYHYLLFPIIPVLTLLFNVYCSYNFSKSLLDHYSSSNLNGTRIISNICCLISV